MERNFTVAIERSQGLRPFRMIDANSASEAFGWAMNVAAPEERSLVGSRFAFLHLRAFCGSARKEPECRPEARVRHLLNRRY